MKSIYYKLENKTKLIIISFSTGCRLQFCEETAENGSKSGVFLKWKPRKRENSYLSEDVF